jgi:hypothetical protein
MCGVPPFGPQLTNFMLSGFYIAGKTKNASRYCDGAKKPSQQGKPEER